MEERNYASISRRAVAFLIDAFFILVVLRVTYLRPNTFPGLFDTRILVVLILTVAYEALLIFYLGSTMGKFAMGIRIVDYGTGESPSILQCIVRPWVKVFFGLWVVNISIMRAIGFLFTVADFAKMASDSEYRAIHDTLAGTVAVSTR